MKFHGFAPTGAEPGRCFIAARVDLLPISETPDSFTVAKFDWRGEVYVGVTIEADDLSPLGKAMQSGRRIIQPYGTHDNDILVISSIGLVSACDSGSLLPAGRRTDNLKNDILRTFASVATIQPRGLLMPAASGQRPHGDGVAHLTLHGEIDHGLARRLSAEIVAAESRTIFLSIDSEGGNYLDSVDLHNLLQQHPHHVVTRAVGKCYSGAAIAWLAGDRREMTADGRVMFHPAGYRPDKHLTAKQLRNAARESERCDGETAALMAAAINLDLEVCREIIESERYWTATEAIAVGLADAIDHDTPTATPKPVPATFRAIAGPFKASASVTAPEMNPGQYYRPGDLARYKGAIYRCRSQGWLADSLLPSNSGAMWAPT